MGLKSRRLGQNYEREALAVLHQAGLSARRTAASGGQAGHVGDIELDGGGKTLTVEVKYSSVDRGMGIIREYLKPVDLLFSRAPGEAWIVSMRADLAVQLLADSVNLRRNIEGGNR
jgi:Holliday junction resolvase